MNIEPFKTLFYLSPMGAALIDSVTGQIWLANQRYAELLGFPLDEVQRLDWMSITHPDDIQPSLDKLAQITRGEISSFVIEKRYLHLVGREIWVRLMVSRIDLDDYPNPCFYYLAEEITQRKQAEQQLRESEQAFRQLFEQSSDPVLLIRDQVFSDCNNACLRLLGYQDKSEVIGRTPWHISPTYQPDGQLSQLKAQAMLTDATHQSYRRFEWQHLRADGSAVDVEVSLTAMTVRGEFVVHVSWRDITERKQAELKLRQQEEQLQMVLEGGHLGFWDWNIATGQVCRNRIWAKMLGYTFEEIQHTTQQWTDFIYPEDRERAWKSIFDALESRSSRHKIEYRMLHKDGSLRWILDHASIVQRDTEGKPLRMSGIHLDITERKQAETELAIAATVFESQLGMMITDNQGKILRVNRAFVAMTGYTQAELLGKNPRILSSGRQDATFYRMLWQTILQTGSWHGEIWDKRKNGEIYPQWLTITAVRNQDSGETSHYVATMMDITERKITEQQIQQLAFYDPLTKLPNRRLLLERIRHGMDVSNRFGQHMALLMLDLDRFKAVNDNLGHAAGDDLLQQVAIRIKACLREVDTVARLGGDEFVVLLEGVSSLDDIACIANEIIHSLQQPFCLQSNRLADVGVSIGISLYPVHGTEVEQLIEHADIALYHAKDAGRGCFVWFSDDLTRKTRARLALEARLRDAIEQHELQVYFQPQLDVLTGQLVGAEALVRWQDGEHGLVMPSQFIGLAETTGLIAPLGEWVLRETCRLGKHWLDAGLMPITLSVNVSPFQFRRCDIYNLVTRVLADTGFPAAQLALEITETGLMENQQQALEILQRLHQSGIHLAIDDFGTGYSSLACLKLFPLDTLKIDKSFIDDIPRLGHNQVIAATIIAMAHHLGFKVLAEGVELAEQLAFLRQHDCDYYQGHWHSEALSVDEFERLLSEQSAQTCG